MQNVEFRKLEKLYIPDVTIIDEDDQYQSVDYLNVSVYTSNPDECANMPVRDFLGF